MEVKWRRENEVNEVTLVTGDEKYQNKKRRERKRGDGRKQKTQRGKTGS